MNPLDRPVWASLSTTHVPLSVGDDRARRYRPDINRFASARDNDKTSLEALVQLVGEGKEIYILQVPSIVVPGALQTRMTGTGVQMVAHELAAAPATSHDIVPLGERDADDMLALATLTRPGPFLRHTFHMGRFVGIRIDGRLAAMAGERFRFPGHTEVSGVCTHPDFRGHGLAQALSHHVASRIAARGDTPLLHAWSDNTSAIRLYEKLGFRLRCEVNIAALGRADAR